MSLPTSPLEAVNVARVFAGGGGVRDASLALQPGTITALLGPSGSGKSTLLRMLAGLEPVDSGHVASNGVIVSSPTVMLPPERRRIGIVFQDFALFPHLSVIDNVSFGVRGRSRSERHGIAEKHLAGVGLLDRATAKPHELSGGEQQRVALARALSSDPIAVLLDEPFSGLDPSLRASVRDTTLQALRAAEIPALLVTHEADEAVMFADTIAVIEQGVLIQEATPTELYRCPNSLAALAALGPPNTIIAFRRDGLVRTVFGSFDVAGPDGNGVLACRPEDVQLSDDANGPGLVTSVRGVGSNRVVTLVPALDRSAPWRAQVPVTGRSFEAGQRVSVALGAAHFFPD